MHKHAGIMIFIVQSDCVLADKEGIQASSPIGSCRPVIGLWERWLAEGKAFHRTARQGLPPQCHASAIIMLMTMMVIILLSRGGVMGEWQNESLVGYHLDKMASIASCLMVMVSMCVPYS
jgi:hypothetical protein